MSTNYYIECDCCKNHTHIGKVSMRNRFLFRVYEKGNRRNLPKSINAWKRYTPGRAIVDEYGRGISHKDFWKMVRECETVDTNGVRFLAKIFENFRRKIK